MASQGRAAMPRVSKPSAKERHDDRAHRRAQAQLLRERPRRDRITALNAINSPLLRLPAEIRNMIFENAFINTAIYIGPMDHKIKNIADSGLSLLLVSRQLHAESSLLPYKLCIFEVHYQYMEPTRYMKRFLQNRSKKQVQSIRDLKLQVFRTVNGETKHVRGTGTNWFRLLDGNNAEKWLLNVVHYLVWEDEQSVTLAADSFGV